MFGVVKWFNDAKGYGFIKPDDDAKDVFVHSSSLQKSRIQGLNEGQRVEFEVAAGRKGSEAINIRIS